MHLLFTNGAFAPAALVLFGSTPFSSDFDFVSLKAVGSFFLGDAKGWNVFTASMKMVRVTVLTKKDRSHRRQREEGHENFPGLNSRLASAKSGQSFR